MISGAMISIFKKGKFYYFFLIIRDWPNLFKKKLKKSFENKFFEKIFFFFPIQAIVKNREDREVDPDYATERYLEIIQKIYFVCINFFQNSNNKKNLMYTKRKI
ncbi:hypothetical protein EDEG_02302 [Edhazardia aedis USNM 41457]|uniref:Uncharacterized protein n=1 Tax=Edhazardia aedis (strain USNM 41457) TaxID=1003232 RepID=J9DL74_EDHAE|nr:hypothetical protein EDEG_02302 [Edhazardia aedis USNM 41457]|eukprot:EJW03345.1 hypothetical protein EDEG_02302 [Edhazardia aedis USNM 41457]